MTSISAVALSGMTAASAGLQASAHNLANLNTGGFRRQGVIQAADAPAGVSVAVSRAASPGNFMESDMVGLLQAKNAFMANLAVFRAQDRVLGSLLDVAG